MNVLHGNHPSIPAILRMLGIEDDLVTGFTLTVDVDKVAQLEVRRSASINEAEITSKVYNLVPVNEKT